MNILLLGAGGREHALAWKISQSKHCSQLYIAPGNGGTGQYGTNVNIGVNDFKAIEQLCHDQKIDMVVVGPEDPLVNGIFDVLKIQAPGVKVVGPSQFAAQLEGSKAFAKEFMKRQNIPTAAYAEFTADNYEEGVAYLQNHDLPIVLKADGLAAGKGVVICQTHEEALQVFEEMIQHKQFGEASAKVVVEQFLDGIEVSVFALTDGKDYKIIGHAKDYKRIGEGDTGLNTGGMGCVSPVPFVDDVFMQKVIDRIVTPTIDGFYKENFEYLGFVFFGLIKVGTEPMVIEYNCRMGDPETEVVLPLLKTDIVKLFLKMHEGTLGNADIEIADQSAATIMTVSGGYPGDYEKGKLITLPAAESLPADVQIFHAGTKLNERAEVLTNGGRVITVTSLASSIQEAAAKSKAVAAQIKFEGRYFRNDIGYEFE
jgi:phosphoribosylamine--glycine ligase